MILIRLTHVGWISCLLWAWVSSSVTEQSDCLAVKTEPVCMDHPPRKATAGDLTIPPYLTAPTLDSRLWDRMCTKLIPSPLPVSSSFLPLPRWLSPCSPTLPHWFVPPAHTMLFLRLCSVCFLAGNAALIRINIWVLFTGSQSARTAWGIQLHKLSWWEINDKLRKGGSWGSNSKLFQILVWRLSPSWFSTVRKVVVGRG